MFLFFSFSSSSSSSFVSSPPPLPSSLSPPPSFQRASGGSFVNEASLLSTSTFPISPPALVARAKECLRLGAGVEDPSILAQDFEFCAPFVGPIGKDEYVGALKSFDLLTAFPDMDQQYYNIHCDPFDHDRVWWSTRPTATHTGNLFGKEPTGNRLELPPQTNSFKFTEAGLIKEMTVGYVLDRRQGNTGGLGGAFGEFEGGGARLSASSEALCSPPRGALLSCTFLSSLRSSLLFSSLLFNYLLEIISAGGVETLGGSAIWLEIPPEGPLRAREAFRGLISFGLTLLLWLRSCCSFPSISLIV